MIHSDEPEMQPESPPEPSLDDVLDAALSESAAHPVPPAAPEAPEPAADDADPDGLDFLEPQLEPEETAAEEAAVQPAPPAGAPLPPPPVAAPDAELERLQAENADLRDRYMRAMAELENVRKRSRRELERSTNLAKANVLRELLEVADNFGRALDNASFEEGSRESGLAEGVRLIYVQFMDILRQHGCERIHAKGQPFDPNLHEAISQIETDQVPSQHVVEVIQEGYRLNDNVLRPARVVVAA